MNDGRGYLCMVNASGVDPFRRPLFSLATSRDGPARALAHSITGARSGARPKDGEGPDEAGTALAARHAITTGFIRFRCFCYASPGRRRRKMIRRETYNASASSRPVFVDKPAFRPGQTVDGRSRRHRCRDITTWAILQNQFSEIISRCGRGPTGQQFACQSWVERRGHRSVNEHLPF